jgi:hypothetical protein
MEREGVRPVDVQEGDANLVPRFEIHGGVRFLVLL